MLAKIPVLGRLDPLLIGIVVTVGIAALVPADGVALTAFTWASKIAIGLLFFLYGARISPREALAGLAHWRLHLTILLTTFAVFPLLGIVAKVSTQAILSEPLYLGLLFVCLLPSTVQSAIALVSVAKGNVTGAIVSASLSSLLGIFITPALVAWTMTSNGMTFSASAVVDIVTMLLLPFLAGQLLRRWIGTWITTHSAPLKIVDRGSIMLVVFVAFSRGMNEGIWSNLTLARLGVVVGACLLILLAVLGLTWVAAPRLGFSAADRVTIMFCGSTKSLATGIPMATVLFPDDTLGLIVLPLMLFHQMQLLIGAALAAQLAKRTAVPVEV